MMYGISFKCRYRDWFRGSLIKSVSSLLRHFVLGQIYPIHIVLTIVGWSHTQGINLYVFRFISALSCRVPCPDGIKLQSLGNVRFRNWRREVGKMAIATTSSSKLSDHRKGHVAIGNTHTHYMALCYLYFKLTLYSPLQKAYFRAFQTRYTYIILLWVMFIFWSKQTRVPHKWATR